MTLLMNKKSARFVIDPALGRLAKWLRIMGIDAHYQTAYQKLELEILLAEGRILLTRNRALYNRLNPAIFIKSNNIQDQLKELKENGFLPVANKNWFKRCIICNIPLESVQIEDARGRIPEYAASQNIRGVKFCPSCQKHFWPGSHRVNILAQVKNWGLSYLTDHQ